MKKWMVLQCFFWAAWAMAQKESSLQLTISEDTVGLNGGIELRLVVHNATVKKLNPPNLEGFQAQGPMQSSSISMVNGDISRSTTFTYYLKPESVGTYTIGAVECETDAGKLSATGKTVVVVEQYESSKPKPRQKQPFGFGEEWDMFPNPFPAPRQRGEERKSARKKYEVEKI